MIKQLGGVRSVPKPDAVSVTEALNLLIVMGGDNKTAAKILKEMQSVQAHNKSLLAEANEAINEANRLQQQVDESRAKLKHDILVNDNAIVARQAVLARSEGAIAEEKKAFDETAKSVSADLETRVGAIDSNERALAKRDRDCRAYEKKLSRRADGIKQAESDNTALRAELNKRDQRMQAAMGK